MIKLFKHFHKEEWFLIIVSIIFIISQAWLDLHIPEYMSNITYLITNETTELGPILEMGGKMILCAIGSLVTAMTVGYFAAKIAAKFAKRLRREIFCKVESFSMEEMGKFSTSSLITRSTNDITQIQRFVAIGLQVIIKAPIISIMAIDKIIQNGRMEWSILVAGSVLALVMVIVAVMRYTIPKFEKIQKITDDVNRVTRENLTGLEVIRAYNAEEYQENKFNKVNTELTDNNLKVQKRMAVLHPSMVFILNFISLGIYWIGAFLINEVSGVGQMALFSNMVVFSSYAMQVIMAFTLLTIVFVMLPRASISAKRINQVLDTKTKLKEGTKKEGKEKGTVEFKNVSFSYPDSEEYVVKNINFSAKKGETVALIGATGSGKTTIINLALRAYDVQKGEVFVDGINVKEYTKNALCNKFGYVPQKAILFSGTVNSNIAYGDNGQEKTTQEEVKKAIEIAQSKDFVEKLENGYDGMVAQGGSNFSGGQKQRLAIARAIARKPEIYIFDDSFSALDYKTDKLLRKELKEKTAGVTTLIVAQRIGTIKDADKILVIKDGEIVGNGKHEELLKVCEEYKKIAYSQLSKEELEG